jgi:hypothetical protein
MWVYYYALQATSKASWTAKRLDKHTMGSIGAAVHSPDMHDIDQNISLATSIYLLFRWLICPAATA